MYKEDLSLNSLQWLICHKNPIKPTELFKIFGKKDKENPARNFNLQVRTYFVFFT